VRGVYAPTDEVRDPACAPRANRARSGARGPGAGAGVRCEYECEPRFHRRRSTGRADGLRPPSCSAWTLVRSRELDWPSNVTRPRKASAVLLRPSGEGRTGRYRGFSPNETMNLRGNLFHCRLACRVLRYIVGLRFFLLSNPS
jgi:hypothetical protein